MLGFILVGPREDGIFEGARLEGLLVGAAIDSIRFTNNK